MKIINRNHELVKLYIKKKSNQRKKPFNVEKVQKQKEKVET